MSIIRIFAWAILVIATYLAISHTNLRKDWPKFDLTNQITNSSNNSSDNIENFRTWLPDTAPSVHASTVIPLKNGNWRAFWFAGSREGAPDVVIASSVFDTQTKTWSEPIAVIDRTRTQQGLLRYISKLGNPLPARSPTGELQLYYVAVSLGGWAGSSISMIQSTDEGQTWSKPKRLITSPFINISNLVKSPTFNFSDDTIGLPSYHEFIGKFGELLQIDPQTGNVINKRRMSSGREAIQPIIYINDADNAIAYFRQTRSHGPAQIITSASTNAGLNWKTGDDLNLANPNSAVAGLTLGNKNRLLVLNDLTEGRHRLTLVASKPKPSSTSNEYSNWEIIEVIENETPDGINPIEFSYPYLAQASNGDIQLVYTWNRKKIRSIFFNESAINKKLDSLLENTSGELK